MERSPISYIKKEGGRNDKAKTKGDASFVENAVKPTLQEVSIFAPIGGLSCCNALEKSALT